MRLAHALLPLLLQACWATAQDLPAAERVIAFQGEWTCRISNCAFCCWVRQGPDQTHAAPSGTLVSSLNVRAIDGGLVRVLGIPQLGVPFPVTPPAKPLGSGHHG